jgi:hypothetical protein
MPVTVLDGGYGLSEALSTVNPLAADNHESMTPNHPPMTTTKVFDRPHNEINFKIRAHYVNYCQRQCAFVTRRKYTTELVKVQDIND